jgi:hypothetical protein
VKVIEVAQDGDADDDARVTICHVLDSRHEIVCGVLTLERPAAAIVYLHESSATLSING